MAINTGMRRGEIFDLKWFDVDFNRRMVHIRQSKSGRPRAIPLFVVFSAMALAVVNVRFFCASDAPACLFKYDIADAICSAVTAISCPIGMRVIEILLQDRGDSIRPPFSPGNSIPERSPKPKRRMYS